MFSQITKNIMNGIVMLIGIYMIYLGWGSISPPLLSGIAFILITMVNCNYSNGNKKKK